MTGTTIYFVEQRIIELGATEPEIVWLKANDCFDNIAHVAANADPKTPVAVGVFFEYKRKQNAFLKAFPQHRDAWRPETAYRPEGFSR